MKAVYKDQVLAESTDTVQVEGNHYFPPNSIHKEFFKESQTHTTCPWKGEASYYSLEVGGEKLEDAAWYYPAPKEAASNIINFVAFYTSKGIEIKE